MWWIFALLSALFASLTALFAKKGLNGVNPDLATAIRTVIILFLAWSIVIFKGNFQSISQLTKQNWLYLILSGLATGLSWIFYFRAMQLGKLSEVATVDKLSLALTILLAFIFLGEPITWKTLVGGGLVVAGSLVLIL
jgi:bacterial/archaeal transporter family protein